MVFWRSMTAQVLAINKQWKTAKTPKRMHRRSPSPSPPFFSSQTGQYRVQTDGYGQDDVVWADNGVSIKKYLRPAARIPAVQQTTTINHHSRKRRGIGTYQRAAVNVRYIPCTSPPIKTQGITMNTALNETPPLHRDRTAALSHTISLTLCPPAPLPCSSSLFLCLRTTAVYINIALLWVFEAILARQ